MKTKRASPIKSAIVTPYHLAGPFHIRRNIRVTPQTRGLFEYTRAPFGRDIWGEDTGGLRFASVSMYTMTI